MECTNCKTEMTRQYVDEDGDRTFEHSGNQDKPLTVWDIYRYTCQQCGHEEYKEENHRPCVNSLCS